MSTKDFENHIRANWLADIEIDYMDMGIKDFEKAFAIYLGLDLLYHGFKPRTYNDPNYFLMSEKLDKPRRVQS